MVESATSLSGHADPPAELLAPPPVRRVSPWSAFRWLGLGWQDLRATWPVSIIYGLLFAAAGWGILAYAAPRPYLITAAVSGFVLVAPLLAAGLYETSRRRQVGQAVSFSGSLEGWSRNGSSMAQFGLLLALISIAWERISAILFALLYGGQLATLESFLVDVFLSGRHLPFVVAYVITGALLAALVFSLTAVSLPMLVDRRADMVTAMVTSCRAVAANPAAMLVWALAIVALMAAGFATALIGMIVLLPWVAHATWHAYRDVVET